MNYLRTIYLKNCNGIFVVNIVAVEVSYNLTLTSHTARNQLKWGLKEDYSYSLLQ